MQLKLFVLNGHKASKEKKMQFAYLVNLILEQRLHLNLGRLHSILNFTKPKTKHQLWKFLGLASYCQKWIPFFFSMAQTPYVLLKNDKPYSTVWKD